MMRRGRVSDEIDVIKACLSASACASARSALGTEVFTVKGARSALFVRDRNYGNYINHFHEFIYISRGMFAQLGGHERFRRQADLIKASSARHRFVQIHKAARNNVQTPSNHMRH